MLIFAILIVGVFILAWVAVSLCLYKIAQKLGAQYTWMAWVPLIQSFYVLYIAKFQWWLIAILVIVTFVGSADRKFGLLNLISAIAWIVAWMKISEMRRRPKWWGIIMIIPLVNLLVLKKLAYDEAPGQTPLSEEPESAIAQPPAA